MEMLLILLIVSFIVVVYQDFTFRRIHVVLPIVIFCLAIAVTLKKDMFSVTNLYYSISFLVLNFAVITVYFSVKNKKLINPFKSHIGLGDLLFLLAVIPLFIFRTYILFFIFGMFFCLLLFFTFNKKWKHKTIPLAGCLSLFIIILFGINQISGYNLFIEPLF